MNDDADARFAALVDEALAEIPTPFSEQLRSVAIIIADEPTGDELASVGAPGLFGLYSGVPRTAWGAAGAPIPSKITIFRGPIERAYPGREAMARAVRDTVFHEVAHHLGIGDARLHELARQKSG